LKQRCLSEEMIRKNRLEKMENKFAVTEAAIVDGKMMVVDEEDDYTIIPDCVPFKIIRTTDASTSLQELTIKFRVEEYW
jgi:hypothetical protein